MPDITMCSGKAHNPKCSGAVRCYELLNFEVYMKAYLVKKTMGDGAVEGVLFTDKDDAIDALSGDCEDGSTLACNWCELYGGDDGIELQEIEI